MPEPPTSLRSSCSGTKDSSRVYVRCQARCGRSRTGANGRGQYLAPLHARFDKGLQAGWEGARRGGQREHARRGRGGATMRCDAAARRSWRTRGSAAPTARPPRSCGVGGRSWRRRAHRGTSAERRRRRWSIPQRPGVPPRSIVLVASARGGAAATPSRPWRTERAGQWSAVAARVPQVRRSRRARGARGSTPSRTSGRSARNARPSLSST